MRRFESTSSQLRSWTFPLGTVPAGGSTSPGQRRYRPIEKALLGLERDRLGLAPGVEPPPGKEYIAGQIRAAGRLVDLAQGALLARLEELRLSKEQVSIVLSDGTAKPGRVEAIEKDSILLASAEADRVRIPFAEIAPESLRGATAPGPAQLALLALSGGIDSSFREIVDLGMARDDFLFTLPVVVRLARLELDATAKRAALAVREDSATKKDSPEAEILAARVAALAAILAERKEEILRLFSHTKSEFETGEGEAEALRLFAKKEYAPVLALGKGTAAFPVAAGVLLARFEAEIEGAHDELLARTGWFGFTWSLFPDEKSVKERTKYWDLDPEGQGSILQADGVERRLVMGRGSKRAPEGVILKVAFAAGKDAQAASHWRFLVRSRDGSSNYLRFDNATCALFRTLLQPGAADPEIAKAAFPLKSKSDAERVIALVPLEGHLHVFADGEHVLAVSQADAAIPSQISIGVTQGKAWLNSVKARKSLEEK